MEYMVFHKVIEYKHVIFVLFLILRKNRGQTLLCLKTQMVIKIGHENDQKPSNMTENDEENQIGDCQSGLCNICDMHASYTVSPAIALLSAIPVGEFTADTTAT